MAEYHKKLDSGSVVVQPEVIISSQSLIEKCAPSDLGTIQHVENHLLSFTESVSSPPHAVAKKSLIMFFGQTKLYVTIRSLQYKLKLSAFDSLAFHYLLDTSSISKRIMEVLLRK